MRKKVIWPGMFCLMVLSLVLASCAPSTKAKVSQSSPATTAPTTAANAAPATSTPPVTSTTTTEKPQYGGTLTLSNPSSPLGFDPADSFSVNLWPAQFGWTNNELMTGNWALGPAGSDQTDWTAGYLGQIGLETGSLATSWDLPDSSTIVFHIRQGVHWWNKPPVNGRELTANDVAWSENREWSSPKSFLNMTTTASERPVSITATDNWTVTIKVPPDQQGSLLLLCGDQCHIYAPEVVAKYGSYDDWHNIEGTGPFILTNYVSDDIESYERNPNYWQTDPVGPGKGNQLPYISNINNLIITDQSTVLASFRTGKLDSTTDGGLPFAVTWDDASKLLQEHPELQYKVVNGQAPILYGRLDKTSLPFKDIRVREALNMAIDKQSIINGYYSGKAWMLGAIIPPLSAWKAMYTPLDQLPESAQELFTYNPDQAKQLLTQAGYPNGFTTTIEATTSDADYLSMVASYWAKIGVTLNIKETDPTTFASISRGRSYDQMIYGANTMSAFPWKLSNYRTEMTDDVSFYDSSVERNYYNEMQPYIGKSAADDAKWMAIVKQAVAYAYTQAVGVYMPEPYAYEIWWPWLKNYAGENSIGYDNQAAWAIYTWIDQPLKKSMGY